MIQKQPWAWCFVLLIVCCGCAAVDPNAGKQSYSIDFDAWMGDQPLRCGLTYQNIGKTKANVALQDLRFYVHDVHLVRSNGAKIPLALNQDNSWQRDGVALLDFVDDQGECKTNHPETNTKVTGLALKYDDYDAIHFKVGMPADKNHLDATTALPPFNNTAMWWSWKGGYKYLRLDIKTDKHPGWFFHLGASQCSGTLGIDYKCNKGNLIDAQLLRFKPGINKVVFNAAALLAHLDLNVTLDPKQDKNNDGQPDDLVPGCMTEDDPECQSLFQQLGLPWGSSGKMQQTVFLVK